MVVVVLSIVLCVNYFTKTLCVCTADAFMIIGVFHLSITMKEKIGYDFLLTIYLQKTELLRNLKETRTVNYA